MIDSVALGWSAFRALRMRKAGTIPLNAQRGARETEVTRFVVGPDVALALAAGRAKVPVHHRLLAPTLLRSQVLAQLFGQVRRGELQRQEADAQLEHLRALQIRLLGDRVLQRLAWTIAQELAWDDTFIAEYIALTQLQADALVTKDPAIQIAARRFVGVASIEDVLT